MVPDSAYSVSAEDGVLMDPTSPERTEIEEAFAERWWSDLRRRFFRHNHRAYAIVDGQWQRVPDPKGPHYKPRKRYRPRAHQREALLKRKMRASGQSTG